MMRVSSLFAVLPLLVAGSTAERVPLATPPPATVVESAGANALLVQVSLEERRLRVLLGEDELASFPIAIGKEDHPTPTGQFRITRVVWNPSWVPPDSPWARGRRPTPPGDPNNPMGRVKIFFREPTYYIHGTNDTGSIGRAASHGCIRMLNEDVIALGRLVMEHGGEPREPGWFRGVLNRVTDTRDVRLSRPVAMRIRR